MRGGPNGALREADNNAGLEKKDGKSPNLLHGCVSVSLLICFLLFSHRCWFFPGFLPPMMALQAGFSLTFLLASPSLAFTPSQADQCEYHNFWGFLCVTVFLVGTTALD